MHTRSLSFELLYSRQQCVQMMYLNVKCLHWIGYFVFLFYCLSYQLVYIIKKLQTNNFIMLSEAGKQYQRSKKIKPFQRNQRQRVYKSMSVKVNKAAPHPLFSPFNTVSRDSRDSYLLRVTKQPNINSNYNPRFNLILPLDRRSTIDQAKFERFIGDVKNQDYSIDISTLNSKCKKSQSPSDHQILTVRQTQNWRKTLQNFDFKKQQDSKRLQNPSKKLSIQQTTRQDFMTALQNISQSNFNNFNRFSLIPHAEKSHNFNSDSPHQYLKEVQIRQRSPEYNILTSHEAFIHKSMPTAKGEKRFFLYRQKVATRHDRTDKNWHTILEYDKGKDLKNKTIDFTKTIDRRQNAIHSKYPIRLSLSRPIKIKD